MKTCGILVFGSLALLNSCHPRQFHASASDPQHAWSGVVEARLASSPQRRRYWSDVSQPMASDEGFRTAMTQGIPLLAPDHPVAVRMQRHADGLHAKLVAAGTVPADFPPAKIYVINDPQPKAYSAVINRCFQRGFSPDAPWDSVQVEQKAGVDSNNARISPAPNTSRQLPCELASEGDVQWLLSHLPPDPLRTCQYFIKNDVVMGNPHCFKRRNTTVDGSEVALDFDELWKSRTISWATSSNAIFFSTGFLRNFAKEEEVVAIVFHELAHYYRNHSSSLVSNKPILYRHPEGAFTGKPQPLLPSEIPPEIKEAHSQFYKVDGHSVDFTRVPGIDYQLPLWRIIHEIVINERADSLKGECEREGCPPACTRLLGQRQDPAFRGLLESLAFYAKGNRFVTKTSMAKYPAVEPLLKECFSALPKTVSVSNVPRRLGMPGWRPGNAANLHAFLLDYQAFIEGKLQERRKAWEVLSRSGIRHYSVETEADQMSLEFLHRAGIDPRYGISANLLLTGMEEFAGLGRIGFQQCHALARQNFRNPDGTWVPMAPVNTMDEHYQACYRAFDAAQELASHPEYRQGNFAPLPADEWANLRRSLN